MKKYLCIAFIVLLTLGLCSCVVNVQSTQPAPANGKIMVEYEKDPRYDGDPKYDEVIDTIRIINSITKEEQVLREEIKTGKGHSFHLQPGYYYVIISVYNYYYKYYYQYKTNICYLGENKTLRAIYNGDENKEKPSGNTFCFTRIK